MTDKLNQIKVDEKEVVIDSTTNNSENDESSESSDSSKSNESEQKALEMGWKPLKEFHGTKEDWKGPGAFVKDAELFGALKRQGNMIKDLKATLEDLKFQLAKCEEKGYNQALKDLEGKQKEAVESLDQEALKQANDEYLKLKEQMQISVNETGKSAAPSKSQEELEFETRNKDWYNEDTPENKEMKDIALSISNAILKQDPYLDIGEHIKRIENKVKLMYPNRFKNSKRTEPATVDSGGTKKVSSTLNKNTVDENVLRTAERFVKIGIFKSIDEYLKDAKDKGII